MQSELFHWICSTFEARQTHLVQDMPVSPIQIHQITEIMLPNEAEKVITMCNVSIKVQYYQLLKIKSQAYMLISHLHHKHMVML